MRPTFTLGRIAGIRVGVHWSVAVIFALIAVGLAAGRLPDAHPDRAWPLYAVVGFVAAVVFFASLLAHELAHAILARRNGVEVDDIVLWLLGGAARLRSEAPTPAAELRIAGVGPLVSLVLGVVFGLLAWALDAVAVSRLLVESVAWLAAINILLAVFNAIPAAPLDGGRLLRAFLWWRTGDRLRATTGAAGAGRAFGWLLVVGGLWLFLFAAAFAGLWLALIGWFLVAAATAESQHARLHEVLTGVPVRDAMTPDPVTVPVLLTVGGFLSDPLYQYRHSAFPVLGDDGRPIGLVTVEQAGGVPMEQHRGTTLGEIMVPLSEVRVAAPQDPLSELLPQLEPGGEKRVLVLAEDRLVGIVSPSDINRTVRWLTSHRPTRGPH